MYTVLATTPNKNNINVIVTVKTPYVTGDIVAETNVVLQCGIHAITCTSDQQVADTVRRLQYAANACPKISSFDVAQIAKKLQAQFTLARRSPSKSQNLA